MQITFDPTNTFEAEYVMKLLGEDAPAPKQSTVVEVKGEEVETFDTRAGVELDANGTPWIEAVHSGGQVKNKDGTWRAKRGVGKAELAEAEAGARAEIASRDETVEQVVEEEPTAATEPAPATGMPGMPTPPAMPGGAPTTAREYSEQDMVELYTQKVNEGKLTPDLMNAIYAQHDTNLAELQTNAVKRNAVCNQMESL